MVAIASAPLASVTHLLSTMFWIWIHLLQFDISNQTLDPEEDKRNKPDRPLPAGRITLKNAVILRWVLVPICFSISLAMSVECLYASVCLVALTMIYNELGAHSNHWVIRNIMNAVGLGSFGWGASLIAGTFVRSRLLVDS